MPWMPVCEAFASTRLLPSERITVPAAFTVAPSPTKAVTEPASFAFTSTPLKSMRAPPICFAPASEKWREKASTVSVPFGAPAWPPAVTPASTTAPSTAVTCDSPIVKPSEAATEFVNACAPLPEIGEPLE